MSLYKAGRAVWGQFVPEDDREKYKAIHVDCSVILNREYIIGCDLFMCCNVDLCMY